MMKYACIFLYWLIISLFSENSNDVLASCTKPWNVLSLLVKIFSRFYTLRFLFVDIQIEDNKLYFRERARSKCGSMDYFDQVPGGGDKKVE